MLRLRILARWRKESVEEHIWHLFTEFTEGFFVMTMYCYFCFVRGLKQRICEGPDVGLFLIFTEKVSIYADENDEDDSRLGLGPDDTRGRFEATNSPAAAETSKTARTSNGHQRHDICPLTHRHKQHRRRKNDTYIHYNTITIH